MHKETLTSKDLEKQLFFVELPQLFRKIGAIPQWATQTGYDPDHDRQVAIFGSKTNLKLWRELKGLNKKHYPIHSSSMGTHIDIYGETAIKQFVPQSQMIGVREYHRQKKA